MTHKVSSVSRTAKTVKDNNGKVYRPRLINGVEAISPFGRHSMSLTVYADKIVK